MITLRKVSETASKITLGWDPPVGVEWYLFYAGGVRVSNAAPVDKNGVVKNTVQFAKTPTPQEVVAITRRAGVMGVSNPSGSSVNLTMSVGTDAAGTRLFDAFPIPAGTQRDFRMHQPLTNGQTIQAFGSTTGVLNVTLNGRDD